MLFRNLYNKSFFLPKLAVRFAISLDKEAADAINEVETEEKIGHNETADYKKAMEGAAATTLEDMRDRSANIRTRLKEGKGLANLTRKGFVEKMIDEKAETEVRAKATATPPEKMYIDKVALIDNTFTAKVKRILGLSLKKYALISEKVNTCNGLIDDLEAQIKAAQDLQGFYKSAREYCKGRGLPFGRLKFPLRGLVVDPIHYRENQEMLHIVQEIQRDARMKKAEYSRRIQEKFNQEYKLEGNLSNILLRYNPKLATSIKDILQKNAMGNGKELEDVIKDLEDNHLVSPKEADALRAMASVLQSKKASKAKAFEIAGRESISYEKMDQILANMGKLKKGDKFEVIFKGGVIKEYTALEIKTSKDKTKRFLVAEGPAGKIAFNLTDQKYTEKTLVVGAGATRSITKEMKDKVLKLKIYK